MEDDPAIDIAYIVNGFPGRSETFIANEIQLLEAMGLSLRIYSINPEQDLMGHGVVHAIRAPVTSVPSAGTSGRSFVSWFKRKVAMLGAQARLLVRRPRKYLRMLAHLIAMAWKYRNGALPGTFFIKEFAQATEIAAQVLDLATVRHLHAHHCDGTATVAWFVSLLTGLPFSFTAHGKDIHECKLNRVELLRRKILGAQFVATCSAGDLRGLSEICPEYQGLHTVYPGLDVGYFAPQPVPIENRPPVILSVGRFIEKKGFEYLIAACAQLKAAGVNFCCWLVGPADDHSDRIERTIETLGVSDVVSTNGAVTQDQLRQLYRRASVFVLPCLQMDDGECEGIPSVLAEAMAMGIPVVSTDIAGVSELINNGKNGLLVPQRDSQALARVIQALLGSPELSWRLAQDGRRTVCHNFDSRRTKLQLRDLLTAVAHEDPHPEAMPDPHPLP